MNLLDQTFSYRTGLTFCPTRQSLPQADLQLSPFCSYNYCIPHFHFHIFFWIFQRSHSSFIISPISLQPCLYLGILTLIFFCHHPPISPIHGFVNTLFSGNFYNFIFSSISPINLLIEFYNYVFFWVFLYFYSFFSILLFH